MEVIEEVVDKLMAYGSATRHILDLLAGGASVGVTAVSSGQLAHVNGLLVHLWLMNVVVVVINNFYWPSMWFCQGEEEVGC